MKRALTVAELVGRTLVEARIARAADYELEVDPTAWDDLSPDARGMWIAVAGELLQRLGVLGLHVTLAPDGSHVVGSPTSSLPPPPRLAGFSGEACPECGSGRTQRVGLCLTCADCGSSGCS